MSEPDTNYAALEKENLALNEQVKLLTKVEQRLYRAQNAMDRQLTRIQALVDFSLRCSGMSAVVSILKEAEDFLNSTFNLDQILPVQLVEKSTGIALVGMAAKHDAPTTEYLLSKEEVDCLQSLTQVAVSYVDGERPINPSLAAVCKVLDCCLATQSGNMPDGSGNFGTVIVVPFRTTGRALSSLLLLRKLANTPPSYFLADPNEEHLVFLQLLASHMERALQTAALTEDLQQRGSELTRSNKALQASLDDLAQTQQQLLQTSKMEAIGQLAGGVAHDFNNLLTVILSYASLAASDPEAQSPQCQEDIHEITGAANRAAELTRKLLAFGRKQARRPEAVNLNELVSEMVKMLRRLIGEHLSLQINLDPNICCIYADPGQLEQVLLNLVVNARDASTSGGTITIETKDQMVSQTGEDGCQTNQYTTLCVTDVGHGMDEETRGRVFEPFFTTKKVGEGTGMGLAMVYGIVKQNEGTIYVSSEPGRGAQFSARFPAAVQEKNQATATEVTGQLAGTETILLVEDEDIIRQLSRRVLTQKGYTVLTASNGAEALGMFADQSHDIQLLVTDVVMPKLGGVELAEKLRVDRPDLRVLFMSGYMGSMLNAQGLSGPVEHLLQKPFTPEKLLAQVRNVLGTS